jgi:hypothetical protein
MITTCSNSSSTNKDTLPESSINKNEIKTFISVEKTNSIAHMLARTQEIINQQLEYIKEIEKYTEKIKTILNDQNENLIHTKTLVQESTEYLIEHINGKEEEIAEIMKNNIEKQEEYLEKMTKNQEEFRKLINKTNL